MKKNLIKFFVTFTILCIFHPANARTQPPAAEDLLENTQENEVILKTEQNVIFNERNKKYFPGLFDNNEDDIEDDKSVMNNNELDFEVLKMFDKDNDNKTDENTISGKIIHSKIVRTDVPSYLFKDDLTFKFEKGIISRVQFYGGYRGSLGALFNEGKYDTEYENLTTQVGMYGSFKNPDYKFKLAFNPVVKSDTNYLDRFISDAYIVNTSIPNHQIVAGYSRVQTGVEGGTSSYILPFAARSQIARNFGNSRSLALKVLGNYQYIDYNLAVGSSGRYIPEGMTGAEFNGWINIKPFGHRSNKLGKLTIGGGFNGGHNRINYGVGSVYLGYHHKKLWANFEAAIADGYNGSYGVSEKKACGFAATVGWKLNPHLQIIGRIDQFDPDRDVSHNLKREYTAGINWFIKGQALKFILNYVFCQNPSTKDSHRIIFATQIMI